MCPHQRNEDSLSSRIVAWSLTLMPTQLCLGGNLWSSSSLDVSVMSPLILTHMWDQERKDCDSRNGIHFTRNRTNIHPSLS